MQFEPASLVFPECEQLYVSGMGWLETPDLPGTLTEFYLSGMHHLVVPPDFRDAPGIQVLRYTNSRTSTTPDLSPLTDLRELDFRESVGARLRSGGDRRVEAAVHRLLRGPRAAMSAAGYSMIA